MVQPDEVKSNGTQPANKKQKLSNVEEKRWVFHKRNKNKNKKNKHTVSSREAQQLQPWSYWYSQNELERIRLQIYQGIASEKDKKKHFELTGETFHSIKSMLDAEKEWLCNLISLGNSSKEQDERYRQLTGKTRRPLVKSEPVPREEERTNEKETTEAGNTPTGSEGIDVEGGGKEKAGKVGAASRGKKRGKEKADFEQTVSSSGRVGLKTRIAERTKAVSEGKDASQEIAVADPVAQPAHPALAADQVQASAPTANPVPATTPAPSAPATAHETAGVSATAPPAVPVASVGTAGTGIAAGAATTPPGTQTGESQESPREGIALLQEYRTLRLFILIERDNRDEVIARNGLVPLVEESDAVIPEAPGADIAGDIQKLKFELEDIKRTNRNLLKHIRAGA